MLASYEASLNNIEARTGRTRESIIARAMINTAWEFYNQKKYEKAAEMIPKIREAVKKAAEEVLEIYEKREMKTTVPLRLQILPVIVLLVLSSFAILKSRKKGKKHESVNFLKEMKELKRKVEKSDFKRIVEMELRG